MHSTINKPKHAKDCLPKSDDLLEVFIVHSVKGDSITGKCPKARSVKLEGLAFFKPKPRSFGVNGQVESRPNKI